MNKDLLIISLALNGYQLTYRKHLATHKRYAEEMGAEYLLISKPFISKLGVECCWLKLHAARQALRLGYKNVLILDADAWVNEHSPDIRENIVAGKYIYMAKGYTQRFNSGVMLLNNSPACLRFVDTIINNRIYEIPEEDSVGWGENGHVIHFAKHSSIVKELDCVWNNTYKADINDFIKHRNHGPLRTSFMRKMLHKSLAMASRTFIRTTNKLTHNSTKRIPSSWFRQELEMIIQAYPILQQK